MAGSQQVQKAIVMGVERREPSLKIRVKKKEVQISRERVVTYPQYECKELPEYTLLTVN